jgi:probable HAF family extracellular repeat protein
MTKLEAPPFMIFGVTDINNFGAMVGTGGNPQHAFVFIDQSITDLGHGQGMGINDLNEVMLYGSGQAFLWKEGQITSLGIMAGFLSTFRTAINVNGQIVGIMSFPDPPISGVPEPSPLLLLLSGLVIIAFRYSALYRAH